MFNLYYDKLNTYNWQPVCDRLNLVHISLFSQKVHHTTYLTHSTKSPSFDVLSLTRNVPYCSCFSRMLSVLLLDNLPKYQLQGYKKQPTQECESWPTNKYPQHFSLCDVVQPAFSENVWNWQTDKTFWKSWQSEMKLPAGLD